MKGSTNFASETDPAADDYSFYYTGTMGGIKNYNGVEETQL
jgi:hypothetical protein